MSRRLGRTPSGAKGKNAVLLVRLKTQLLATAFAPELSTFNRALTF